MEKHKPRVVLTDPVSDWGILGQIFDTFASAFGFGSSHRALDIAIARADIARSELQRSMWREGEKSKGPQDPVEAAFWEAARKAKPTAGTIFMPPPESSRD